MNEENGTSLVIASGDEGLQLNSGRRLAFVGAGYGLDYFDLAVKALTADLGSHPVLISAQEDDWLAAKLESKNQAIYDEKLREFAAGAGLDYAGQIDFGDPKDLTDGVRGHLVRPPKIHVAEQICLTVGGGEQVYSLRQFVISADYAHALRSDQVQALIGTQIDYYNHLVGKKLRVVMSDEGNMSDKLKIANKAKVAAFVS